MKRGNSYAVMSDPDRNPMFRRTWNEPRQIGEITEEITRTTALKAITRLLGLAAETTGSECAELLESADEIRGIAGLDWGDVIGKQAA